MEGVEDREAGALEEGRGSEVEEGEEVEGRLREWVKVLLVLLGLGEGGSAEVGLGEPGEVGDL